MTLRVEVPGEKIFNIESCKCNNPYKNEKINKDKIKTNIFKEYSKKVWALRSKVTVEPYIICYILPSVLSGLAVQNLCLEKACLVNLKYSEDICHHIMRGNTQNYTEEEKNVQTMVTNMTGWSFPLQSALPGILSLFIGAWSDRTGNRKILMVLPMLGKIFSIFGIILSTIFFFQVGLSETALIEGLPPALAGGRVVMTMAVYSYVTDITSESERTFRLGIITALLTLIRSIGLALSGVMLKRFGYYGVFSTACVFYMTGFVYILLRLKEKPQKSVDSDDDYKTLQSVFSIQDFFATVNVGFKKRPGSRRLQIILVLIAYMLIVGPVLGEGQMTYWFTRYSYKFTEVDYSLFLTYSVLVGIVGSFITIYLFSKRWQMEDNVIGILACLSRIAASVVSALAKNRTIYFLGPLLDMFSSAAATSLRSIATKLVNTDEVGKTSSLISISEALAPVIYSPVYSRVYVSTLSSFAGCFYLISAGLAVPAIVIYVILFVLQRRENKENSKENKPKEDEVTRF